MSNETTPKPAADAPPSAATPPKLPERVLKKSPGPTLAKEIGGAPGPEPTRYGDWQHKGRVTDF